MRLKQVLGLLILSLVMSTVGMAADSQLTNVSAAAQGNATVITLHASGAFTHTEYRPTDTLLLVDLSGVSAGKWKENTRTLDLPGVSSYHVVGYTGTAGSEVARVELNIAPGAMVDVQQSGGALNIKISDKAGMRSVPPGTIAEPKPAHVEKAVAMKPASVLGSGLIMVSNISVVRGEGSMDIEIVGSGPMTAKAMKLSSPARVVIDIANAVPGRNKTIPVNSDEIKAVRMGQFQSEPPVTRVVVDLASAREFELLPTGNKVVVKVRASQTALKRPVSKPVVSAPVSVPVVATNQSPAVAAITVQQVPEVPAAPAQIASSSAPAETTIPTPSNDFVVVDPQYHEAKPESINDPKANAEAAANVIATGMKTADANLMPPVSASMAQPTPAPQQPATSAPAPARPRYTGEPISVNLKDVDLKDFFRLIHEISGLNIVLDPNVKGSLTLVLDDVPWDQALDLVLANNGLDRKLDGNVLRIATVDTLRREADAQRAKNEAEALSVPKVTLTHFLSYARAADVVPTVKRFLSQRGDVIADTRTNSLIIQDIPGSIPEVQRLLTQLDRKTEEVEIEARVIAATRNFARDIGIQLGAGWGNSTTAIGGAPAVGNSPNQVGYFNPPPYITSPGIGGSTTPKTSTTAASIPLFSNLAALAPTSGISLVNLGSNYRLDAILTAAESRGLLKILSRPRVVTQNNVQANVKQGVRIPVVTAAQLGGPPTTTYIEAFLRLTVTPQITVEKTIFLNLDVENTTPDFSRQVQGNPTLITQQATTAVLVTDGGTVVIGGVIQTQNSVTVQQVPLLGDLPVLGNLFKRRAVSTSTQELLFFVTPRIVQT
jgi:type IV pilus assembly protein PilQ